MLLCLCLCLGVIVGGVGICSRGVQNECLTRAFRSAAIDFKLVETLEVKDHDETVQAVMRDTSCYRSLLIIESRNLSIHSEGYTTSNIYSAGSTNG